MNTVKYVNGLVSEGTIGTTEVYTSIQRIQHTCHDCGHLCKSDVWDKGPHGHDACGLIRCHNFCQECGSAVLLHFYEGCIVSIETISAHSEADDNGELRWWHNNGVGQYIHQEPVGQRWNVAEQRRYTDKEWRDMIHGPHWKIYDDEIPF